MNSLPKELEDIIIDYKYQMETTEKYQKSLDIIKGLKIYHSYNYKGGFSKFWVSVKIDFQYSWDTINNIL